ncbi:reverse transcriptase, partial [Phytophthora megakarya]
MLTGRVESNAEETTGDLERARDSTTPSGSSPYCQEEESWIANIKQFFDGDISELSKREAKNCAKIAEQYEVGESGLLYYHRPSEKTYCTTTTQVWMAGIRASVRRINGQYGTLDLGRTAQTVAESYEEAVFRRFGASEAIRHDREPGFMSDFFRVFNKLMGQRQRATLAYRPQANGAAERMVQTITRAIKMYIADVDQRNWDQYAERLTYALNTARDRTRDETLFFLVHDWDPRSTLEATLAV